MRKIATLVTILSASLVATQSMGATAVYVANPNTPGNQAWTGLLGLNFQVNTPVSVSALGAFDPAGNTATSIIDVAIYNLTTNLAVVPLVSISVGPTTAAGYITQNIANVILLPGSYQLTASGYGNILNNFNNSGPGGPIAFNNLGGALTANGTSYSYSTVNNAPATIADNGTTRYGSATFLATAVPEPATWALILLGFGMIGFALRKRSNVRTTISYA